MKTNIKPFTRTDVDFAVTQAQRERWSTGKSFFDLHLQYDPAANYVVWAEGKRVGMITAVKYAATGWLGNLIVEPDYRSKGIGRKLMEYGFAYLRDGGIETIRLDADPPGIPLYRSMGFEDEYESLRLRWIGPPPETGPAVQFIADDLPAAAELDRRYFGDDRTRLLEILFDQTAGNAWAVKSSDALGGFAFVIQSSLGSRIGPCCAVGPDEARALITAAMSRSGGATMSVGVPAPNQTSVKLLNALGFESTTPCLRMVCGPRNAAGALGGYFTIASGAVG